MTRTCEICKKEMNQGYCVESGREYYCSDECLHQIYTEKEWQEMYSEDSYWTEWEG